MDQNVPAMGKKRQNRGKRGNVLTIVDVNADDVG